VIIELRVLYGRESMMQIFPVGTGWQYLNVMTQWQLF